MCNAHVLVPTCAMFAVLATCVPVASANEIVYVGADGNVWLTAPDGSRNGPVTADATAATPYRDPSLGDDGTISVLRGPEVLSLDRAGTRRLPASASAGSDSPLGLDVSPAGALYWYEADRALARVTSLVPGLPGGACSLSVACHDGYTLPRWIPGTPDFAAVRVPEGNWLFVHTRSGAHRWVGSSSGWVFLSYDITRAGFRLLAEVATSYSQANPSMLLYWENRIAPPLSAAPESYCVGLGFAGGFADVSWSPGGTAFAWAGSGGVYVSPAPVISDDGCRIQPRLLVAGGSQPDWGTVRAEPTPEPVPTATPAVVAPAEPPAPVSTAAAAAGLVSGLRIRPTTFSAREGARVRYRSAAGGTTRFSVERTARGVRRGASCVKATRRARGRRCTRFIPTAMSWTEASVPGTNTFRFDGRRLRPGAYRLTAHTTGASAKALFAIR